MMHTADPDQPLYPVPAPVTERFEAALKRLVVEIPAGIDSTLDGYRHSESGDATFSTTINRQVRAFLLYQRYAETGRRFLDWGCRHAWDSCLVRMVNDHARIDGCDVTATMAAAPQKFARLHYTQLTHTWKIPYEDNSFDRVIGSGVLEHVPFLGRSLEEINRITEVGGYLIITFLPNKYSWTEFVSRNIIKKSYHLRLYSRDQLKKTLLEHGFEPLEIGYHQVMPSLTSGHQSLRRPWMGKAVRALFKLDPLAERVWPLRLLAANLYAVARKLDYL
jgi:ubiquinone/menaquinone biosynthesis C-methylase UbiE